MQKAPEKNDGENEISESKPELLDIDPRIFDALDECMRSEDITKVVRVDQQFKSDPDLYKQWNELSRLTRMYAIGKLSGFFLQAFEQLLESSDGLREYALGCQVDLYTEGQLNGAELEAFEKRMRYDKVLKEDVTDTITLTSSLMAVLAMRERFLKWEKWEIN